MPINLGIGGVVKVFGSYSNRLLAVLIVIVTVVAEGVVELSVYRCPCDPILRKQYAIPFLIIPIFLLLLAGIVFNQKARKKIEQCCEIRYINEDQTKTCSRFCCGEYLNIFGFASIAPSVWIVLTLIDGDYVACAASSDAYQIMPNTTCIPDKAIFTAEYRNHKRQSQTAGWIVAGIFGVIALIIYCIAQNCCTSMTGDEQRFRSECEQIVDEALVKACRQCAEEVATASLSSSDGENPGFPIDADTFWKSNCERFETKRMRVIKATMEKFLANRKRENAGYRQDKSQPSTNSPSNTNGRREDVKPVLTPTLSLEERPITMGVLQQADDISSTSSRVMLQAKFAQSVAGVR